MGFSTSSWIRIDPSGLGKDVPKGFFRTGSDSLEFSGSVLKRINGFILKRGSLRILMDYWYQSGFSYIFSDYDTRLRIFFCKSGSFDLFYLDVCRFDVAFDQLRGDRLHRMFRSSPWDGRPRVAHPVADPGSRDHVTAPHRSTHVQSQLQRDYGGHTSCSKTQSQQFHVR